MALRDTELFVHGFMVFIILFNILFLSSPNPGRYSINNLTYGVYWTAPARIWVTVWCLLDVGFCLCFWFHILKIVMQIETIEVSVASRGCAAAREVLGSRGTASDSRNNTHLLYVCGAPSIQW